MPAINGPRTPVFRDTDLSVLLVRHTHSGRKLYYTGIDLCGQKVRWREDIGFAHHFETKAEAIECIDEQKLLRKINATDRLVVARLRLVNVEVFSHVPAKRRKNTKDK